MTDLELERAEVRRLERMLAAQKAKVAAMERPKLSLVRQGGAQTPTTYRTTLAFAR